MASLPQHPQAAHSLWLQRRSTRRAVRQVQWRSDWSAVGLVLLLLGVLVLLSVFLPTNEAVERVRQAAQANRGGSQDLPVVGVLAEP